MAPLLVGGFGLFLLVVSDYFIWQEVKHRSQYGPETGPYAHNIESMSYFFCALAVVVGLTAIGLAIWLATR